jgi:hypothetical protein
VKAEGGYRKTFLKTKKSGNVVGGCIGPSSQEEEALARKASLNVPMDSAYVAERQFD